MAPKQPQVGVMAPKQPQPGAVVAKPPLQNAPTRPAMPLAPKQAAPKQPLVRKDLSKRPPLQLKPWRPPGPVVGSGVSPAAGQPAVFDAIGGADLPDGSMASAPSTPTGVPGPASPAAVDKDFVVDKDKRYPGTVSTFFKWHGYGYIQPKDEKVAPGGQVWVGAEAIQTADRYPFLLKDMEVEFGVTKAVERGETILRATAVTLAGGAHIALQHEEDVLKEFVGGAGARYAGKLKFFIPNKGFGYISLEENLAFDTELGLPQEICVELVEVNCGGQRPKWMYNLEVEFGIFKGEGARFMAYNMTLPGGKIITDENLLHREQVGADLYSGAVTFWHWSDNWGFIKLDEELDIPDVVMKKIALMQKASPKQAAATRGKPLSQRGSNVYFTNSDMLEPFCPEEGQRVTFNLYVDDKGAGATHILLDVPSS